MTANRRIFLNIVATYGRSLYALVVGLFCGRWSLMALGEADFGLYGVVGGMTGFISFFNSVLAFSISRFYATTITKMEECQKWFSIAMVIHTVVPSILILVGYPMGVWAIECFLTIPQDRILDCVWVFRFVCVSCFLSMASVPFNAMYQAKQYIAELTVYSFVTTTLNAGFLYYMVTHQGEWLTRYAFWMCLLSITPQIIIAVRAIFMFPECKFRLNAIFEFIRLRELFSYTGWQLFGATGGLLRSQGIQILVNKYFGPSVNASMSIANQVNSQTQSLSGAMIGAFQPAISTSYGEGCNVRMNVLSYSACKFGLLFCLVFTLPLFIEMNEIMLIWLKTPPDYAVDFCRCMMLVAVIDRSSIGHMLAINAKGKLASYQTTLGCVLIATLPIAWAFSSKGFGPVNAIGIALIVTTLCCSVGRVLFARALLGLSVKYWLLGIVLPIACSIFLAASFGVLPQLFMGASFIRVILSTVVTEIFFVPSVWFLVLNNTEKSIVLDKLRKVKDRIWQSVLQ